MEYRERAMEGLGINMISVIMLTYNRELLVGRAIESVLGQTYRDFEFIIVDNGSTDSSGKIADEYAEKDSRICVIHRERGNIGSGRNTGLDAAQGEYITFIDDDDWCEPDFLEFLYTLAVENDADVAICGAEKEEQGVSRQVGIDQKVVLEPESAVVDLMWRKRFNNGFPTKLFHCSLFNELRFPNQGRYDDIYLMYRVLADAKCVVSFGLPKYHVTRHENNNSAATTKDRMITPQYLDDYRHAYRQRTIWLSERFPNKTAMWWYFDWSFQLSMVNKIISNHFLDCKTHLEQMCSEIRSHYDEFYNCPWIMDFEKEWCRRYL